MKKIIKEDNSNILKEEIYIPKIFATKEYQIFKDIQGNRIIKKPYIKLLENSISEKNLLAHSPIIINEKFEVIDGQHRLKVAINKGLYIYYTIAKEANLKEIILLNASTLKWDLKDYLISYIQQEFPEYIKVSKFSQKYPFLTISIILMLLNNSFSDIGKQRTIFKNGLFICTHEKGAEILAQHIQELLPFLKEKVFYSRDFIWTLRDVLKQINFSDLIYKLKTYNFYLYRQPHRKGYFRQFEDIINHRQQSNLYRFF